MAKQSIKKTRVLEIKGYLDIDENNEYIVTVEDKEYKLNDLLEDMCGTELNLKCIDEL